MPEPTTSATDAAPAAVEDQPIRERVKELTSQFLQQGRVDPEAVREVASAVLGRTPGSTAVILHDRGDQPGRTRRCARRDRNLHGLAVAPRRLFCAPPRLRRCAAVAIARRCLGARG